MLECHIKEIYSHQTNYKSITKLPLSLTNGIKSLNLVQVFKYIKHILNPIEHFKA